MFRFVRSSSKSPCDILEIWSIVGCSFALRPDRSEEIHGKSDFTRIKSAFAAIFDFEKDSLDVAHFRLWTAHPSFHYQLGLQGISWTQINISNRIFLPSEYVDTV